MYDGIGDAKGSQIMSFSAARKTTISTQPRRNPIPKEKP